MAFEFPPSFDARAVVCSRIIANKKDPAYGSYSFDAELYVYGKQYLLGSEYKTREEAQNRADIAVTVLNNILKSALQTYVSVFKEAKP